MAAKRIAICSDGTWNTPDAKVGGKFHPSNVVKVAYAIAPQAADGTAQVVFYDAGLGTRWGVDRLTGGAFGQGISQNIKDAYRFLVNNYHPGDEIYLFGFSRGAFTVRSTGGLIRTCGVLRKENARRIDEAYEIYRNKQPGGADSDQAVAFRDRYSHAPVQAGDKVTRIRMIGVWDTVGSLGVPGWGLRYLTRKLHRFHDAKLNSYVDFAYHALAIDEKRKPFRPTLWAPKAAPGQVVEQVWFAGVHTDVGGGYPECGLSDVAYRWMVDKAQTAGLRFLEGVFADEHLAIHPDPLGKIHESKTGMYRLTAAHHRPIGIVENGHESVDPNVRVRWDGLPDYRPRELEAHWKRQGGRPDPPEPE